MEPKVPLFGRLPRSQHPRRTSSTLTKSRSKLGSRFCPKLPHPSRSPLPFGTVDPASRLACTFASSSFSFFVCDTWIYLCHPFPVPEEWDRAIAESNRRDDCYADDERCVELPTAVFEEPPLAPKERPELIPARRRTVYPNCDPWPVPSSAGHDGSIRGTRFSLPSTISPSCRCCNCAVPVSRWTRSRPCTRAETQYEGRVSLGFSLESRVFLSEKLSNVRKLFQLVVK